MRRRQSSAAAGKAERVHRQPGRGEGWRREGATAVSWWPRILFSLAGHQHRLRRRHVSILGTRQTARLQRCIVRALEESSSPTASLPGDSRQKLVRAKTLRAAWWRIRSESHSNSTSFPRRRAAEPSPGFCFLFPRGEKDFVSALGSPEISNCLLSGVIHFLSPKAVVPFLPYAIHITPPEPYALALPSRHHSTKPVIHPNQAIHHLTTPQSIYPFSTWNLGTSQQGRKSFPSEPAGRRANEEKKSS